MLHGTPAPSRTARSPGTVATPSGRLTWVRSATASTAVSAILARLGPVRSGS